ncbi:alpha/beta fold hydrolase [Devosia sp.]|uniref:alpha/beta fold hydrolase n=1 Tax=Devosia sp. TaxID=1871048 RepID=UPI001B0DAE41|nr:alpha/beta fold hydrolase [Devosia sp.]MBO9590601.1 alpha/beta hydrolase [Devosia sp.]
MITVLFIHSAGPQGPGEGSSALLEALRAMLPPDLKLIAPLMPEPDAPAAEPWIAAVEAEVRAIEGDFVLVGHSLGGSTILQVLTRFGVPDRLLGVVTLAAPFWSAEDWQIAEFALPEDAGTRLQALSRLFILQGDRDEVVAKNHPELYRALLPQAQISILPGIDHEAATAAPDLLKAIRSITGP